MNQIHLIHCKYCQLLSPDLNSDLRYNFDPRLDAENNDYREEIREVACEVCTELVINIRKVERRWYNHQTTFYYFFRLIYQFAKLEKRRTDKGKWKNNYLNFKLKNLKNSTLTEDEILYIFKDACYNERKVLRQEYSLLNISIGKYVKFMQDRQIKNESH